MIKNEPLEKLIEKFGYRVALETNIKFNEKYEKKHGTAFHYCTLHLDHPAPLEVYLRRMEAVKHRYFNKVIHAYDRQLPLELQ